MDYKDYIRDFFDPEQYEEGSTYKFLIGAGVSVSAVTASGLIYKYFHVPTEEQVANISTGSIKKKTLPSFYRIPETESEETIPIAEPAGQIIPQEHELIIP